MRGQLATLDNTAPAFAQLNQQLSAMAALQRRIGSASIMDLIAVRGEVAALVTQAQSAVASAQSTSGNGTTQLQQASSAARETTRDFLHSYYDKHEFDAYLEFTSKKDEEEFRKREATRRAELEEALALDTPEGNAKAIKIAREQLEDAGAHGADRSSEFSAKLGKLEAAKSVLDGALRSQIPTTGADPDTVKAKAVAPDVLAGLKSLQVPDQTGTGHGIGIQEKQDARGRTT